MHRIIHTVEPHATLAWSRLTKLERVEAKVPCRTAEKQVKDSLLFKRAARTYAGSDLGVVLLGEVRERMYSHNLRLPGRLPSR